MKLDEKTSYIINMYKTPCFIFDEKEIKCQIDKIRSISGKKNGLCFAVKANPFIVPLMDKFIDRFEACSPGEYSILVNNGITTDKIIYSGVNKSFEEIKSLYDEDFRGICTIESVCQWNHLKKVLAQKNTRVNILLRLSSGNQFGVSEGDLLSIISECKNNSKCNICGIHFFSGTQKKNVCEVKRDLVYIDNVCRNVFEKEGVKVCEIEYGVGLYADLFSDKEDSGYLSSVFENINGSLSNYKVTIELGRYLTYTCGKYYTSVVDTKNTGHNNYAIVDGGIHHINYYGQLLGIRVPIVKRYSEEEIDDKSMEFIICGSLCSVNDILIKRWKGNVNVSDIFEFSNAGAYSFTEGSSLFLSRDLPAIISVSDKEIMLLRDHVATFPLNNGSRVHARQIKGFTTVAYNHSMDFD